MTTDDHQQTFFYVHVECTKMHHWVGGGMGGCGMGGIGLASTFPSILVRYLQWPRLRSVSVAGTIDGGRDL